MSVMSYLSWRKNNCNTKLKRVYYTCARLRLFEVNFPRSMLKIKETRINMVGLHFSDGSRRGLPTSYSSTKLRPEGPKNLFWRPAPPPPYRRVWMTAPLYLKVWILYCIYRNIPFIIGFIK